MAVTRTLEFNDLSPQELAELFCEMGSDEQAAFFAAVWQKSKTWPGAGWCQQSYGIAEQADNDAIQAIRTLASHLPADDVAWIVSASADA